MATDNGEINAPIANKYSYHLSTFNQNQKRSKKLSLDSDKKISLYNLWYRIDRIFKNSLNSHFSTLIEIVNV